MDTFEQKERQLLLSVAGVWLGGLAAGTMLALPQWFAAIALVASLALLLLPGRILARIRPGRRRAR